MELRPGEAESLSGREERLCAQRHSRAGPRAGHFPVVEARPFGLVEVWGKRFNDFSSLGRYYMGSGTLSQFIESSKVLIENARAVPELSGCLAAYGYDTARLAEGQRLWSKADALVRKQAKEYGEQHEATAVAEQARAEVESAYMKTLKVARVALAEESLANSALKLYGPRKETLSGLIDQASTFYANLCTEPKFCQKMLRFGYLPQKLQAEAMLVENLRQKIQLQAKETGEAQAATAERDKKIAELDAWVSDLRAIARVAFYESPQELEKLGIVALNSPRLKKTEKAAAPKG
jgi:hypothetical protein